MNHFMEDLGDLGMAASGATALCVSVFQCPMHEVTGPAPVFYPTMEDMRDPVGYLTNITHEASDYGIAKIVPPPEWQVLHIQLL